jgi:hypothetical protein
VRHVEKSLDSCTRALPKRQLLAVLCNPPLKRAESTISWRNVQCLASVLNCDSFVVENLIELPTRSSRELRGVADLLDLAQIASRLEGAAREADVVVVGWGTGAPAGWRKARWNTVLRAAIEGLGSAGHDRVAHVSTSPRHPSRWRQHTSSVHGRYSGETFEQRLASSIRWTLLSEWSSHAAASAEDFGKCRHRLRGF